MFIPLYALKDDVTRLGVRPGSNVELVTKSFLKAHSFALPEVYVYVFDLPSQAVAAEAVISDQGNELNACGAFRLDSGHGVLILAMHGSDEAGKVTIYDKRRMANDQVEGSWEMNHAQATARMGRYEVENNRAQALASIVEEASTDPATLNRVQDELERCEGATISYLKLSAADLKASRPEAAELQTLSPSMVQHEMVSLARRDIHGFDVAAVEEKILKTLSGNMPREIPEPF